MDVHASQRLWMIASAATPRVGPQASRKRPPLRIKSRSLVVSSLPGCDEATAGAGILVNKIQSTVGRFVKGGICMLADFKTLNDVDICEVVFRAYTVVVVLSQGSLECPQQLQLIAECFGSDSHVEVVPVTLPSFKFPAKEYYDEYLPSEFQDDSAMMADSVRALFKNIAVQFATHASNKVLDAQAMELLARIPTSMKDVDRTMSIARTESSNSARLRSLSSKRSSRASREPSFGRASNSVTKANTDDAEDVNGSLSHDLEADASYN